MPSSQVYGRDSEGFEALIGDMCKLRLSIHPQIHITHNPQRSMTQRQVPLPGVLKGFAIGVLQPFYDASLHTVDMRLHYTRHRDDRDYTE